MSCVFCSIVAGQAPAVRIYEDDSCVAFLDIRPISRGHTLVVPKRHTADLTDTPPDTLAELVTIGQRIALAARATKLADATNVALNDGPAAFQTVRHIHLHILPRRNGDKLSLAKGALLRRNVSPDETGQLLRDALARIDTDKKD
jgi:diadenosine tetraphosphate (Ap4A) HIT family hydrolase